MRVGYGRLTVYLGAAAGCGKTYAMLDQAHQLKAEHVDVVAAFVETHGRADTARKLEGLEVLPRLEFNAGGMRYSELDVEALLTRRPQVALIDELGTSGELERYHLFHAARADMLRRLGCFEAAADAYRRALALMENGVERAYLERRLAAL